MHWNLITCTTHRQLVEETLDKTVQTNEKIRIEIERFSTPSLILVRLRAWSAEPDEKCIQTTHTRRSAAAAAVLKRTPNNITINNADLKQIN